MTPEMCKAGVVLGSYVRLNSNFLQYCSTTCLKFACAAYARIESYILIFTPNKNYVLPMYLEKFVYLNM